MFEAKVLIIPVFKQGTRLSCGKMSVAITGRARMRGTGPWDMTSLPSATNYFRAPYLSVGWGTLNQVGRDRHAPAQCGRRCVSVVGGGTEALRFAAIKSLLINRGSRRPPGTIALCSSFERSLLFLAVSRSCWLLIPDVSQTRGCCIHQIGWYRDHSRRRFVSAALQMHALSELSIVRRLPSKAD